MMKGTVTRVLLSKGYGFIRGEDGKSRFFHVTSVEPQRDFERMFEGQAVTFTAVKGKAGNGEAAVNVCAVS